MNDPQADRELKPQEFEFESMNLQVGMRLQFITHRRLKPVQHFSTLIGWSKDEYLIVKIPMDNGAPIALVEGERVTMRVFSGIHVCSFACTVERVFGRPLLYAHISFPRTIQGTSLRTAMRVKVDIPARIFTANSAVLVAECLLTNLSVNGARIEAQKSLPQDEDEFDLEFLLQAPPNNQEVRVRARAAVRNISALTGGAEQAEGFAYGVQFISLNPAHYTLVQNLTYEALLADRQKIV
ncbi:flagellar brake domain-containing protein [Massilia sp. CT11-137]|uniref:flagellar brake domain-containing protein n=1 Tax=Massilia sp. CT11-137 TaxID=3393901 RepID=UPI0039A76877